ncbi:hypothetical protein NL676_019706 [Syzygium grande]|nr:hypothetical protein NL676_019706 [Syzygium grande]
MMADSTVASLRGHLRICLTLDVAGVYTKLLTSPNSSSDAAGDAQWLRGKANSLPLGQTIVERSSGFTPDYWSRDIVERVGPIAVVQHGRIAASGDRGGISLAGRWSQSEQQITAASEQEHGGSTSLRSGCRLKLAPKR